MPQKINYGGLSGEYCSYDKSKIAIIPVPYDGTSTWIKGADKGPEAIMEASANMELYDIETGSEVYTKGIFTDTPVTEKSSPEKMVEAVRKRVEDHLGKEKFSVVIGGEHSVSIGTIQAHASFHKDICVLQIDAHSDLRQEYLGSKYNHACVMARVKEICPIVQVGIRSMDSEEKKFMDKERVFFAEQIYSDNDWIDKFMSKLAKKVYITTDLDGFDPSIMPATGTPEPGGLQWYNTLKLLRKVFEEKEVVGFDIVELCPFPNQKASDFLAAKLIYKILSYKFK